MKLPHWLTQARDMHNAARDRRQATRKLTERMALRREARQEANPHKRGWITRAINAGAA